MTRREKIAYWFFEARYSFVRKYVYPWYYPIKDFFFPHNVLKLRNCPRCWTDRSERLVHAIFSMLCDFVEKEKDGREKFAADIAESTTPTEHWTPSEYEIRMIADQDETDKEILALYDWYMGHNWEDPDGTNAYWESGGRDYNWAKQLEESQVKKEKEMMLRAIETKGAWWT